MICSYCLGFLFGGITMPRGAGGHCPHGMPEVQTVGWRIQLVKVYVPQMPYVANSEVQLLPLFLKSVA